MRLAADAHGLVDRLQNAVTFAAHVRRVDAAELRGFGGQRNDLFGLRVGRGRIFKRSGDSDRAVVHRVADQSFHLFELLGVGLHVSVTQHHAPHLRRADVAGEIDAHALLFQAREVLAEAFASRE